MASAPHVMLHTPELQTWPLGHTLPHAPQFVLSTFRLAQYSAPPPPGSQVVSVPQVRLHLPALHTWPLGHVVPHVPQLALSVLRFAQ